MRMLLLLLGLLLLPCAPAAEALRVLIIGNSYTFYNNLPAVLEALSRKTACPLEVSSYTAGAMSLHSFLTMPRHAKARQMVESGQFDWVILQDQSQTPAFKPEETLSSVQQWCSIARRSRTKVLLFLTWAHASRQGNALLPMLDMQERTSSTYCRAALQNKARVAPAGEAWAAWHRRKPEISLYDKDGSHPNPTGTYLTACVLHASISGKALKNLPGTLRAGGRTLISLPATTARELQKTANSTLKSFTPESWLQKQEQKSAARPSADNIRQALRKDMNIKELMQLAGKPVMVTSHGGRKTYQFQLRNNAELCAYCSPQGQIQQVSIATPGQMAEIIDLQLTIGNPVKTMQLD